MTGRKTQIKSILFQTQSGMALVKQSRMVDTDTGEECSSGKYGIGSYHTGVEED